MRSRFLDQLERALDRHSGLEVVSFDLFDTLVRRLTSPETARSIELANIRDMLATRGVAVPPREDWQRADASWRSALRSRAPEAEVERTTADWLRELAASAVLSAPPNLLASVAAAATLETELMLCSAAPWARAAIDLVRSRGLRVVVTSDTWHDTATISALLEGHALSVDEVFASGSLHVSKRGGGIFALVEAQLAIRGHQILHIGDSLRSDVLRPRAAGWKSLWRPFRAPSLPPPLLPRIARSLSPPGRVNQEDLGRALAAPDAGGSTLYRIGYDHLAPLLALFALFQRQVFRRARVDEVLFVARDAHLPYGAIETLGTALDWPWPSTYLRISRRVTALAHAGDLLETAHGVPGRAGKDTIGALLRGFALPETFYQRLLEGSGLTPSSPVNERTRAALRAGTRELADELARLRADQRLLLRDYVLTALSSSTKRLGIVDVGWAGTVQDSLHDALPETVSLHGAYLGLSSQGRAPEDSSTKAGLFRDDRGPPVGPPGLAMAGVVRLWDLLLREPIGTTLRLERTNDGRVEPVLAPWARDFESERHAALEIARGFHAGLLARRDGIRALVAGEGFLPLEALRTAAAFIAARLCLRPTADEARALLSLRVEEADGRPLSLGSIGARGMTTWIHGIVSANRLGASLPVLDAGIAAAAAILRR